MNAHGFCSASDEHEAVTPGSSLDRRTLLRGTGQASIAAGLAAAGLSGITLADAAAAPSARLQVADCDRLTVIAKRAVKIESDVECDRCECEGAITYHLRQRFHALLTEAKCDESGEMIPEESVLQGEIERWLRVPGPCETWVGYHRGTFQIEANGNVVIEGEIAGTDGFDSRAEDTCCHPEIQEGTLLGKGQGDLKGCLFTASYLGIVPVDDKERPPCDSGQWSDWEFSFSGVLACPCGGDGCPGDPICVDLSTIEQSELPVPYEDPQSGIMFDAGQLAVRDFGGSFTGLSINTEIRVSLPREACEAEVVIVHYAGEPSLPVVSVEQGGVEIFREETGPQRDQEHVIRVNPGQPFTDILIEAPSDESLLVRLCYKPVQ